MDRLDAMATLIAAVDGGSLSAAAATYCGAPFSLTESAWRVS